jgi:hypothetical protein
MGDAGDLEGIERWVAEARAADAVESRVRERWLRTQAAESSTFGGVLLSLAEAGATVTVVTVAGRRHVGVVTMVGEDFFTLRRTEERTTMLACAAVASVEPPGARRPINADDECRRTPSPVTLRDVFSHAVGDRPRLLLYAGTSRTAGQLVAVGTDVVTVRTEAEPPGVAYVPLGSVSEASLLDSG